MRLFNRKPRVDVAVSWATACDLRRLLDSAAWTQWNVESLSPADRKSLGRIQYHLDAARDDVMAMQASLSRRSKELGEDHPDFEASRLLNG